MNISRRTVLSGAATLAGAATLTSGCEPDDQPPFDPADWASVRAQFALDPGRAHLASFVFASHPAPVRDAISRFRTELDADTGAALAAEADRDAAVASAAARYLATKPEQIAFTDSTTMGLALLYSGLRLDPGDEILTTEHDFYSTHETLRLRAERDGATVRRVRLYADPATATTGEIVDNLRRAVTARTRVVAVTWVHSSTGVRLPIRELASVTGDALLCVDGVHGFGVEDARPDQLGCDFLVSGGHKWLYGPRGTGLVWGSERGWARYTPVIPSFDRASIGAWLGFPGQSAAGPRATPGEYHSFEHRWALDAAFGFHERIGRERVTARSHALAAALKERLSGVRGVRLITPTEPALSAGLVVCSVDGQEPAQVVRRLRAKSVLASTTPYDPSYVRFGTSIVNDESDVDMCVRAMVAL